MPEAAIAAPNETPQITKVALKAAVGQRGAELTGGLRLNAIQRGIIQNAETFITAGRERDAMNKLAGGESESSRIKKKDREDAGKNLVGLEQSINKFRSSEQTTVKNTLDLFGAYVNGGYDNIAAASPAERAARQTELREQVKRMVASDRRLREVVTTGTPPYTISDELAADLLRDSLVQDHALLAFGETASDAVVNSIKAAGDDSQDSAPILRAARTAIAAGANRAINDRASDFLTRYNDEHGKVIGRLEEKATKQMEAAKDKRLTTEHNRWFFFGKAKRMNTGQINKDMRQLIADGPRALATQVLQDSGVNYADRQALLADDTFMEQQGKKLAAEAMVMYAASGGKFDQGTGEAISNTTWGPEAITAMLQRSEGVKEAAKRIFGENGEYKAETVREWMKKPENQKKIGKVLLLAGGAVAGASLVAGPDKVLPLAVPVVNAVGKAVTAVASGFTAWKDYWFPPSWVGWADPSKNTFTTLKPGKPY